MLPELTSALAGVAVAFLGAATLVIGAVGLYYAGLVKDRRVIAAKQNEIQIKELELKQLEADARIRAAQRQAAMDAAAIVEEQVRGDGGHLDGHQKAILAAVKLKELSPSMADVDGSRLTDLVRLGVSDLRSQRTAIANQTTTYLVTPSQAPPPDVVRQGAPEDRPTLPPLRGRLGPGGKP
jgi:hypothetical protein